MVKTIKKLSKRKSSKSSKSRKSKALSKSYRNKGKTSKRLMRGGDDGRYVLPPAYFGKGTNGYYANGSPELQSKGNQHAVSQGTISGNGLFAGPNLYPMLGGNCACNSRKSKSKSKK